MVYKPKRVHVIMLEQSLKRLGIHSALSPILNQITLWVQSNGEEWTVDRLKQLKVILLQLRAGTTPDWNWISHRGSLPKGVFRSVFKKGLSDDRLMSAALSVLQFYTTFRSPTLTKAQEKKAISAITSPGTLYSDPGVSGVARGFSRMFRKFYNERFSFAGWTTSKPTYVKRDYRPWLSSFLEGCFLGGPWTPILRNMGVPTDPGRDAEWYGDITVIQEKGYKARVVASPNAAAQVAFRPLHLALGKILKGLGTDCTHNQLSGALWAQEQLREGKRLWSVDLSSATDRFPLELQLRVLRALGYQWEPQFARMCKGLWRDKLRHTDGYLSYRAGQPMGLYGSFALFGLTHNFLLRSLGGTQDTYRIVGDDVIISDQQLYWRYQEWLEVNGVPVSWHKSLMDTNVAEFAGYLITPTRLVKGVKYPDGLIDPYAFVQQTRVLGYPIYSVVPHKFLPYAKHLVELPEDFGGAGLNPRGLPKLERVSGYMTSLDLPKSPILIGPNQELAMPFASLVPGSREILLFLDDQSKKVSQIARKHFPWMQALPDSVVVSMYFAVSRKGVPLWTSAGSPRSAKAQWITSLHTRTVKPLYSGSWD